AGKERVTCMKYNCHYLNEMSEYLSITQMKKLQEGMLDNFSGIIEKQKQIINQEYLKMLFDGKKYRWCSDVKRRTESGAFGELISVILPIRSCRCGGDDVIQAA
ncbi:MAG: hypothetical protein J6L84_01435, partial [Clostridiales bacterium]|nr:hypothetical protein [Clostridiales bacterium]